MAGVGCLTLIRRLLSRAACSGKDYRCQQCGMRPLYWMFLEGCMTGSWSHKEFQSCTQRTKFAFLRTKVGREEAALKRANEVGGNRVALQRLILLDASTECP